MDIKLILRGVNISFVFSRVSVPQPASGFMMQKKITGEEKFFSHKCLFDTRGLSVKRKHMQYFLYDRYFVNFPSLFLNGFIIFSLWVLEFWGGFGDFVCLFVYEVCCFVWFCLVLLESLCRGGNGRKEDVNGNHVIKLH